MLPRISFTSASEPAGNARPINLLAFSRLIDSPFRATEKYISEASLIPLKYGFLEGEALLYAVFIVI